MRWTVVGLGAVILFVVGLRFLCESDRATSATNSDDPIVSRVYAAIADGTVTIGLTRPEELQKLLPSTVESSASKDGGMELLALRCPGVYAQFGRFVADDPFTLRWLRVNGRAIIARKPMVLRRTNDLVV